MKNQKVLTWGGFLGAIAVVLIVAGVFYFKDINRMAELGKLYPNWKTVEGQITKFQTRFPSEAEYAAQDLPIPGSDRKLQQEIYVGGDDAMSYFVSATLYPDGLVGDKEENLRHALGGMTKSVPGGELVSSQYNVPFLGENYLEYKIYSAENSTSYKGRMFLSPKALYQVYVSYKEPLYNDDTYTYFVKSFQIK